MGISLPKLKAIIKYFCENTNPKFLGKTKLMKLFYFLDFTHVKKYGTPVTGDTYYHLERGPIPSAIKNLVDMADEEPDWALLSDTIEIVKEDGLKIHRVRCMKEFSGKDEDYFSKTQMDTLKEVCSRFKNHTTTQIVNTSHKESPWKSTEELQKIPYKLAVLDKDCKVTQDEIELLETL